MAIVLGVFDLLAYSLPGSLYLAVFAHVSHRAGWIDVPALVGLPSLLLLVGLAVAAFLVGQAASPLGSTLDRVNPFGATGLRHRRAAVVRRVDRAGPGARRRGCLFQSATFRRWAIISTYELCYWHDDGDTEVRDERQAAATDE